MFVNTPALVFGETLMKAQALFSGHLQFHYPMIQKWRYNERRKQLRLVLAISQRQELYPKQQPCMHCFRNVSKTTPYTRPLFPKWQSHMNLVKELHILPTSHAPTL